MDCWSNSVFNQVRNRYSGWFIEGSLRWVNRYNRTHDWQRRFGSERLCDHFICNWQNLDNDNTNVLNDVAEDNGAPTPSKAIHYTQLCWHLSSSTLRLFRTEFFFTHFYNSFIDVCSNNKIASLDRIPTWGRYCLSVLLRSTVPGNSQ